MGSSASALFAPAAPAAPVAPRDDFSDTGVMDIAIYTDGGEDMDMELGDTGGIEALVALLSSNVVGTSETAARVLGNLAKDGGARPAPTEGINGGSGKGSGGGSGGGGSGGCLHQRYQIIYRRTLFL